MGENKTKSVLSLKRLVLTELNFIDKEQKIIMK